MFYTQPYRHQRLAFERALAQDSFALLMAPGTGKTWVDLNLTAARYDAGEIDLAVVVAPNGVHRNWLPEALRHLDPERRIASAFYRAGTTNKGIREALAAKDRLRLVAFNIESLSHKSGFDAVREVLRSTKKAKLSIDEAQRIKTPSSVRTRNVWKLRQLAPADGRILSGTSVTQGLQDLYAQFRFLDPDIIGCRTYTEFKTRYCVLWGTYNQIVGYQNVEELQQRIAPWSFTAELEDCVDMPGQSLIEPPVELSPEQKKHYAEIKHEYITQLADGQLVEAELAIQRLQKLHQIVSGHISAGNGAWVPLATPRLQQAVDLVEDARGKTIIWCRWRPDLFQLSERLTKAGVKHVVYDGPAEAKAARLRQFKEDAHTKVFLGTPMSGGVGLTINEAKTVINYSHSFSYEDRYQSLARNYRIGQDTPVVVYDMVAPGTVDRKVLTALRNKQSVADLMKDPTIFRTWLEED